MVRTIVIALLSLMIPFSAVYAGWLDDVANGVRNVKDITDTTKDVVGQPEQRDDSGERKRRAECP